MQRGRVAAFAAGLTLALGAAAARAELCSGEYQPPARPASAIELKKQEVELRRAQERALQAERERAAEQERRRVAELARRAALPPGARLVEDRCTVCHGGDYFAGRGHGRLGWTLVVLRMELLNGARLQVGERAVIARHMAQVHSGGAQRAAAEWLVAAAVPGAVVVLLAVRWRRARRTASPPGKQVAHSRRQ